MRDHMRDYVEFGESPGARASRILAEYFRAVDTMQEIDNRRFVTVFGSARMDSDEPNVLLADRTAYLCVQAGYGVISGGSGGVMEGANHGAFKAANDLGYPVNEYSLGCNITLPKEQKPNQYVGTHLDFHYFFIRKFFLLAYSSAFFFFDGGAGTRDELWEVFCLTQVGKIPYRPIVLVGGDRCWATVMADIEYMVRSKTISPEDRNLIHLVETSEEAASILKEFYRAVVRLEYVKTLEEVQIHLNQVIEHGVLKEIHDKFGVVFRSIEMNSDRKVIFLKGFNMGFFGLLPGILKTINIAAAG